MSLSINKKHIYTILLFCWVALLGLSGCGKLPFYFEEALLPSFRSDYTVHIKCCNDKEKTIPFRYIVVWEAALDYLENQRSTYENDGYNTRLETDKKAGYLCLTIYSTEEYSHAWVSDMVLITSDNSDESKLYYQRVGFIYPKDDFPAFFFLLRSPLTEISERAEKIGNKFE